MRGEDEGDSDGDMDELAEAIEIEVGKKDICEGVTPFRGVKGVDMDIVFGAVLRPTLVMATSSGCRALEKGYSGLCPRSGSCLEGATSPHHG